MNLLIIIFMLPYHYQETQPIEAIIGKLNQIKRRNTENTFSQPQLQHLAQFNKFRSADCMSVGQRVSYTGHNSYIRSPTDYSSHTNRLNTQSYKKIVKPANYSFQYKNSNNFAQKYKLISNDGQKYQKNPRKTRTFLQHPALVRSQSGSNKIQNLQRKSSKILNQVQQYKNNKIIQQHSMAKCRLQFTRKSIRDISKQKRIKTEQEQNKKNNVHSLQNISSNNEVQTQLKKLQLQNIKQYNLLLHNSKPQSNQLSLQKYRRLLNITDSKNTNTTLNLSEKRLPTLNQINGYPPQIQFHESFIVSITPDEQDINKSNHTQVHKNIRQLDDFMLKTYVSVHQQQDPGQIKIQQSMIVLDFFNDQRLANKNQLNDKSLRLYPSDKA